MDTGREARQTAAKYRKAVAYLDGCGQLTFDKLVKATEIAGVEMESELSRMWSQADYVLPESGQPGGKEFVRFTIRKTLIEGAEVFDDLADNLGAPKGAGTAGCASMIALLLLLPPLLVLLVQCVVNSIP
jgi:hypothetical protein